ncbi:MAG: hypothetical protein EPO02_09760 [Nitrospirae bacterium]|nr:MAG: hypothetical protein EPO02_09760 [Nitrospirota bacterium]
MAELLFYNRPARLNRVAHAKLRYTPLPNFEFARKVTSVPLMAAEFPLACRQYPIIFVQSPDGTVIAQAVLSLTEGINTFVNDKGQWTATYVPAFIRRYPFVLAEIPGKPDDFDVAFDEGSGCFHPKKGEPLFDDHGAPSAFLNTQVEFLKNFHGEHQRTRRLLEVLKTDGLLVPYNVDIVRTKDKAQFAVRNALVVDETKLQDLIPEKVAAYLKTGMLAMIYAHLISLQSFLSVANRAGGQADNSFPWWAK